MSKIKFGEIFKNSEATSLSKLDDKTFTIVAVEDSPYEDTPGVKITTKETFEVEGRPYNRFYTTRTAIVSKLKNDKIKKPLADGQETTLLRIVTKVSKKSNKTYFDLEEVNND